MVKLQINEMAQIKYQLDQIKERLDKYTTINPELKTQINFHLNVLTQIFTEQTNQGLNQIRNQKENQS